jgi:hypothetical protein
VNGRPLQAFEIGQRVRVESDGDHNLRVGAVGIIVMIRRDGFVALKLGAGKQGGGVGFVPITCIEEV